MSLHLSISSYYHLLFIFLLCKISQHWVGYISKDIISRIYIQLLDIWSGYISFCQNGYRIWIYIQKFATSSYHIHIQNSPHKHPFLAGFSQVFHLFSPFRRTHWTKAGILLSTFDYNFTFMQWDEVHMSLFSPLPLILLILGYWKCIIGKIGIS